jgi:RNA polymerase sigma-70 factor, ECF subfamily
VIEADRELVRRMLAGDACAFDAFFEDYFHGLYRFAMTRLGRPDLAEEVAQAAICKALFKLRTYRGEATLFSWLCTFCRHEIWSICRKYAVSTRPIELIEETPEVRASLESLGMAAADSASVLDRAETARLVHVALDQLPPRYGSALEWKYLDGLSVCEIAERLELTAKAAESLLTRARETFREIFATLTRCPIAASGEPESSS